MDHPVSQAEAWLEGAALGIWFSVAMQLTRWLWP